MPEINDVKNILDKISTGTIVVDKNHEIIFFNRLAEIITGYSRREVVGKQLFFALGLPDEKILLACHHRSCPQLVDMEGSLSWIHKIDKLETKAKDGHPIYIDYQASPVSFEDDPKKIDVLITFHDISQIVSADKAKDEFLSVASHELRTPLTVIKGNLEMMKSGASGKLPPEARDYLNDSILATDRLMQIVTDILNVSRLEAGRMPIITSQFDLRLITERNVRDFKVLADHRGLKLNYIKPKKPIKVYGDPAKTEEVLTNLIGNALKYTPSGKVTVSHEVKDKYVITKVKDTGPGIKKEDLDTLFQKFSQAHFSLSSYQSGSGLGLYISKEYVEKMGGQIFVISTYGEGSSFVFTLPRKAPKSNATRQKK